MTPHRSWSNRTDESMHHPAFLPSGRTLIGAVVLCGLAGCSGLPQEVLEELKRPHDEFRLGPEDVVQVVVWRNEDLSGEVVVRPDGMVSVPLIGDVRASGLTADELAKQITVRLQEFKQQPSVTVSVKEVNSYAIFVLGQVTKPGKYQVKTHTTVLQAIALAGGFTIFASRNDMQVIRNSANGNSANGNGAPNEMRIPVRYDDLLSGDGVGNFVLRSGDVVVVP